MTTQRSTELGEQIGSSSKSTYVDQVNLLKALQAVYDGTIPSHACVKFNVPHSYITRQMDRNHGLLNIAEEISVVRCVRKVVSAGFIITKRHINDSIDLLSKTLQNSERYATKKKSQYLRHLYRRQPSLLNYIEQNSNNERLSDDEFEKIFSMLKSEFRACGLYENDMRKLLNFCLESDNNNDGKEIEEDNQKRFGKRSPNHLQNGQKSVKKSKFNSIPINSTPLVIADVHSEYEAPNESFVPNLIPHDGTPSTPTLRTPTMFETSVISNQTILSLPDPEINELNQLNATNVLDYIENMIGSKLVLRFYKNGHKKWPVDSNEGLFDLWKAIKAKADQEADTASDDDDGDVKIELVDATKQF